LQFLGLDGVLGNVQAVGINNIGQIVGTAANSLDAFVYDPFDLSFGINGFQNLGALPGSIGSTGSAIGDVAFGAALGVKPPPFATGQSSARAFIWNGNMMYGLGLNGTGNGIDAAGDVAGQDVLNGTYFAQVWLNPSSLGTLEPFGQTGKTISEANAVELLPSPPGQLVAGFEIPPFGANSLGFLYNSVFGKTFIIKPLVGDAEDDVQALNETALLAVGRSYSVGGPSHAFVVSTCGATYYPAHCHTSQSAVALPDLGGNYSSAESVNSAGVIAGNANDSNGLSHAVIWRPTGPNRAYPAYDMNTLNPQYYPPSNWFLTDASGINDHEQIVGMGYVGGASQPFVLSLNRHGLDVSSHSEGAQNSQAWNFLNDLGPYRGLTVVALWQGAPLKGGPGNPLASATLSQAALFGDTAGYILLATNRSGTQQVRDAMDAVTPQQFAALKFVAIDVEYSKFDLPCTSETAPAWQTVISDAIAALPSTTQIVIYTGYDSWTSCVRLGPPNQAANPYAICPLWDTVDDNIDDLAVGGETRKTIGGKVVRTPAFTPYGGWEKRLGKQYGYDTGTGPTGKTPEVAKLEVYTGIASLDDNAFDPGIVMPVQGCFGGGKQRSANAWRFTRSSRVWPRRVRKL